MCALIYPGAEAASERISDKAGADTLKAACEVETAVCVSLTKEKKTAAPPKLFDLTSLQREANKIYGYTAKQTLDLAQTLYEKRLLTYPRTDSAFLTDDMGTRRQRPSPCYPKSSPLWRAQSLPRTFPGRLTAAR